MSLLYGVFHLLIGVLFFGLTMLAEWEMHEDSHRWSLFSAVHSVEKARAKHMPFYTPLVQLSDSQNIVGWYSLRVFLRELKGKFDYCRMEVMFGVLLLQVVNISFAATYWHYFHLAQPLSIVYDEVIGDNALVAFDTFCCLSLVLDMLATAVQINQASGGHASMLLDEEMHRSFSLRGGDASMQGHEGAVTDSIHQLAAVRAKLTAVRESEKLRLLGFKVDESIITYIRTAIVSYVFIFAQSFFTRKGLTGSTPPPK
jgi:hypothetical protein